MMIAPTKRYLIVNADDLGMSEGINRGIFEAHEQGIVTSASLMVRWPAIVEAAHYCEAHPELSPGLHIDLAEWVYRDETWLPLYEVVSTGDASAVEEEAQRQLAAFRSMLGRDPSHLDSHQHMHQQEPVRSIVKEMARRLHIPLRHFSRGIQYCGHFYGQTAEGYPYHEAISVDGLLTILRTLQPGITELCAHPGYADQLDTMYRHERQMELEALCDPRVRAALSEQGIELRSFDDLPN